MGKRKADPNSLRIVDKRLTTVGKFGKVFFDRFERFVRYVYNTSNKKIASLVLHVNQSWKKLRDQYESVADFFNREIVEDIDPISKLKRQRIVRTGNSKEHFYNQVRDDIQADRFIDNLIKDSLNKEVSSYKMPEIPKFKTYWQKPLVPSKNNRLMTPGELLIYNAQRKSLRQKRLKRRHKKKFSKFEFKKWRKKRNSHQRKPYFIDLKNNKGQPVRIGHGWDID